MELEEEYEEEDRYDNIALCLSCANYDLNYCREYRGMPEIFFGRKRKCKYYDGIWEATKI